MFATHRWKHLQSTYRTAPTKIENNSNNSKTMASFHNGQFPVRRAEFGVSQFELLPAGTNCAKVTQFTLPLKFFMLVK
jgi:hypothetical protein